MRLSDARTRGPWRKKWVEFIRAQDLISTLIKSMNNSMDQGQREAFQGAVDLAVAEERKILWEIRRALNAGADEEDLIGDLPSLTDLELPSQRSPRGSAPEPHRRIRAPE